jgi:hypothetical protein
MLFGTNGVEVVKEVIQLLRSMELHHESFIYVTEQTSGLVDLPAECHLFNIFHEGGGNDR